MLLMPDDRTIVLKPIKWYKNLATRKGRLEAEAFLIEGDRTIKQIISNNPESKPDLGEDICYANTQIDYFVITHPGFLLPCVSATKEIVAKWGLAEP